jgi:nucleotide-binding universal stress UspA family protein
MTEPLRVLIAIDGSEDSLAVARCWATWPAPSAGEAPLEALLLHVGASLPQAWPMPGSEPGQIERMLTDLGKGPLEAACAVFAETALTWHSAVQTGTPAEVIVDEAERNRADLVVMGARGLSPIRGLLLGSVAQRVAQTSRLPVWMVPRGAPCPAALGRRLTLLCAVDGSTEAGSAAAWIARLAPKFGAVSVELLCVQPPLAPPEGLLDPEAAGPAHWSQGLGQTAIDAARFAIAAAAPAARLQVGTELRTGDTVEVICQRADEVRADAIVIGSRRPEGRGRTLLGSIASALLQTAHRSVVVVPSPAG